MIPTELQKGLIERVKKTFSHNTFTNPDLKQITLNVFEQHLPEKESNDISHYPFVIVQLIDGEQENEMEQPHTKVLFIVGVFYDKSDNHGHQEVTTIINKIFADLANNPIQSNRYELKYPIRWALHDEDTAPYYFGAIETNWHTLSMNREDVNHLI